MYQGTWIDRVIGFAEYSDLQDIWSFEYTGLQDTRIYRKRDPLDSRQTHSDEKRDQASMGENSTATSPVKRIALIGNVCVGKTCLFDHLCVNHACSANIAGSTRSARQGVLAVGSGGASRGVRRRCGSCKSHHHRRVKPCCNTFSSIKEGPSDNQDCPDGHVRKIIDRGSVTHLYDTPGSATLAVNSEDEIVARDLILSGQIDSLIVVADAKNLRRSLALALEAGEFGLPMVFDLNMLDESENMGIEIDEQALEQELGVPVARTVAIDKRGIRQLAEMMLNPRVRPSKMRFSPALEEALGELEPMLENPMLPPRALAILLLSQDQGAEDWVAEHLGKSRCERIKQKAVDIEREFGTSLKLLFANAFYSQAARIVDRVITSKAESPSLLVRFGRIAQRPLSGSLIALGVLVAAYYWVGAFGATFVVDALSVHVFEGFLLPLCEKMVAPIPSEFIRDAIMDPDFGLLPTGLFLALGLVLPVLFCFYILLAVLEDSGYLPRLAVLLDRLFRWLGLNGQSLIPMILGFSCVTMAVITTRMLPSKRERIILTMLLMLGVPCAPLLAAMMVILNKMPWTAGATVFSLIGIQILVASFVASKLLPGKLPDLILEIPKMRIPRPTIVLSKTWRRTWSFMREAVPIFLLASFVVFLFGRAGGLTLIESMFGPSLQWLLGLPEESIQVFIKTAIRRESGAAELSHLAGHFTNLQLVVTLLVMTFLIPCINAAIVVIKERGVKVGLTTLGLVATWACISGALVNAICRGFGITFM